MKYIWLIDNIKEELKLKSRRLTKTNAVWLFSVLKDVKWLRKENCTKSVLS